MTLLYFKVVTKLLSVQRGEEASLEIGFTYRFTSFALVALLVIGLFFCYGLGFLGMVEILVPTFIIAITLVLLSLKPTTSAQIVKEYHCGEKDVPSIGAYYFTIDDKYKTFITYTSLTLMVIVLLMGFA